MRAATTTLASASTRAVEDPGDLLAGLPDADGIAWVRRGEGFIGWGRAASVPVPSETGRFEAVARELASLFGDRRRSPLGPGTGPLAFASFTFDPRSPGSVVSVPLEILGRRGGRAWRTSLGEGAGGPPAPLRLLPDDPDPVYGGSSIPELRWLEAVARTAAEIRTIGALRKVVLARDLLVTSAHLIDGPRLARRLAERFPECWTFVCAGLVGATPELLLRRRGDQVTSVVLAGSAPRGVDAVEDERIGQALLASPKDRDEHELAVASVRDVLTDRCAELNVERRPSLVRLANVQHLATRVNGRQTGSGTALELAGALHPTAAVCGTPTALALERIPDLEGMDRGRYSGPVGWVDAQGDGEFGIALRCAELGQEGARLFAGAGIVGESLPEAELEETRLKLRAIQSCLEPDRPRNQPPDVGGSRT